MKRFLLILMILSIAISGILIVFSRDIKNKFNIEKPEVLQKLQVNPVAYMVDDNQTYNFMYPFYNEMESFYIDDTIAVLNENDPISVQIDGTQTDEITYVIVDPLLETELVRDPITKSEITTSEKGIRINIKPINLEKEKRYTLNIEANIEGRVVNFYQSFLIDENNQNELLKTVTDAHILMYDGDNDYKKYIKGAEQGGVFYNANQDASEEVLSWESIKDFVKMNEPIPEILSYNPNSGAFQVRLKYIIAMRKAYDFEYWDFSEIYSGTIINGDVKITEYERTGNKKNQPIYDVERLQWVLDEGCAKEESASIMSDNGEYIAFIYKNEVWLLNKSYNELTKVFGFDTLDSDYVMDEGNQHKIKLLELDDKGNIKYLIYGYMAGGDFAGYNGIMINDYNNKKIENESVLFVKLSKDYHALEYYIENTSYYNEEHKKLYLAVQNEVYDIDVKAGTISQIISLPSYSHFTKDGMIYFNDSRMKENLSVKLIDLSSDSIDDKGQQIIFENTYLRVIGSVNEGLIIGTYSIKNTYEYLDGTVFYPYDALYIVDRSGKTTKLAEAEDNTYFQDIVIDKQEGVISGSTYSLIQKANKVAYEKAGERNLFQFNKESMVTDKVLKNQVVNNQNTIRISYVGTSLNEEKAPVASNSHKKYVMLDGQLSTKRKVFEVYNNNQLVGVSNMLEEGLHQSKTNNATCIYAFNNGQRSLIYDVDKQERSVLIDVPIISQKPELIRGCESTALAMFLSHYTGKEISKITLAENLRKDETPKTTINGIISFGDMHKGFVGSVTDRAQPGLGVYSEPIYDLAKDYVEGLHNITGASFDQVLSFVGNGQPVWVITPANYNKVSEYVLQQWITPSGYMEVTFLEHSVVIVGYDDNYVYINDPQQGRMIKQPRLSFQVGWENQGSQALVVIQ